MKEQSNRSSSKYKPSSSSSARNLGQRGTQQRCKRRFSCNWNSACKALLLGLILMFIGGSMATVGYFVDHIYKATDEMANETISLVREKNRLNINSISTYVGPMIMGVGGFIVVAACVMTFEQRDNEAKVVPNRLQLTSSGHGHSMNRHNKPSPSSRAPPTMTFREGSGRRNASASQCGFAYQEPPAVDQFCRRELTADFIQFSRNLQQASLKKKLSDPNPIISRCPSAPNLVTAASDSTILQRSPTGTVEAGQCKRIRNSLHPLIGGDVRTSGAGGLSPIANRSLPRQALSVDTSADYFPKNRSLPCSKHVSRQGSTSTTGGRGSVESLESVRPKRRSPKTSMTLDLRSPVTMQFSETHARTAASDASRFRSKRSDTARRHLLTRQAPVDFEDDSTTVSDREFLFRSSNPQFEAAAIASATRCSHFQSTSTPHSRRESYSPKMTQYCYDGGGSPRFKQLESVVLRGSSPTLQHGRAKYVIRSNTVSVETNYRRRNSNASEVGSRKGSADYNYRNRRKSSNTSDNSSRYCSRTNVTAYSRIRRDSKSPTPSLKSFQDYHDQSQREKIRRIAQCTTSSSGSSKSKNSPKSRTPSSMINKSVSPDSLSVSSSTTEGLSRADPVSIDIDDAQDRL